MLLQGRWTIVETTMLILLLFFSLPGFVYFLLHLPLLFLYLSSIPCLILCHLFRRQGSFEVDHS